jgi:hypothetical protein
MSTAVTGGVTGGINFTASTTVSASAGLSAQFPLTLPSILANSFATSGTGANKCNQLWFSTRTLASSASEDINVYTPSTTDAVGNALTIATVKVLLIQNTSLVETDYLSVGGKGTTAGWTSFLADNTDIIKILGGSTICAIAPGAVGWVVGASTTNHLLTILNSGAASVTYNIAIIGATA